MWDLYKPRKIVKYTPLEEGSKGYQYQDVAGGIRMYQEHKAHLRTFLRAGTSPTTASLTTQLNMVPPSTRYLTGGQRINLEGIVIRK